VKIAELNSNSRKINLTATVTEKEEPREVNTRYGKTRVAEATIDDDSGNIKLVRWGDEIDGIRIGDKVKIENAFIKEWNGELQLSAGKYGRISVL
jgi:replication factor A1